MFQYHRHDKSGNAAGKRLFFENATRNFVTLTDKIILMQPQAISKYVIDRFRPKAVYRGGFLNDRLMLETARLTWS